MKYDGSKWGIMETPTQSSVNSIWGTSINNVYASTTSGIILHYDGLNWEILVDGLPPLFKLWGFNDHIIYALGSAGTMLKYDGEKWTRQFSDTDKGLYGIWGTDPNNLIAVGVDGTIIKYNGDIWRQLPTIISENFSDIWGIRNEVFIVGGYGTILQRSFSNF
jgi:hypothetical protein